jgi:hypothetical protein
MGLREEESEEDCRSHVSHRVKVGLLFRTRRHVHGTQSLGMEGLSRDGYVRQNREGRA